MLSRREKTRAMMFPTVTISDSLKHDKYFPTAYKFIPKICHNGCLRTKTSPFFQRVKVFTMMYSYYCYCRLCFALLLSQFFSPRCSQETLLSFDCHVETLIVKIWESLVSWRSYFLQKNPPLLSSLRGSTSFC